MSALRPASIVGLDTCERLILRWKDSDHIVGFTDGCFDLFHAGHARAISQAADGCDRLVVGIATDHRVAEIKGPGRPIISFSERVAVVRRLAGVDIIVPIGSDEDLRKVAVEFGPDIVFKGQDRGPADIPHGMEAIAQGRALSLTDHDASISTTKIIARIVDAVAKTS